jgi:uncharacterized coiled-coil protein SlyX
MPAWLVQALVGLIIALISTGGAVVVARATSRSSSKTAETTLTGQIESSRILAEQNAFERAEKSLGGIIDRQGTEIAELEKDRLELRAEVSELRRVLAEQGRQMTACRATCRALARRLGEPEPDLGD